MDLKQYRKIKEGTTLDFNNWLVSVYDEMENNKELNKQDLRIISNTLDKFKSLDFDDDSDEFIQLCYMERILKRAAILEKRIHLKLI